MKFMTDIAETLFAPRVVSRHSRKVVDKRQVFLDKVLLPLIFPGFVRPVVKLQNIDVSSSRGNVKK